MKFVIVVVCIFVVAAEHLDKMRENFNQMLEDCKEIVEASDDDVDQYIHRITPESDAGKCLITCVNKKINIQDASGKINPDSTRAAAKILEGVDAKYYHALLNINEKCINEVNNGPHECDIGAQWFTCVNKEQEQAGIPLFLVDE